MAFDPINPDTRFNNSEQIISRTGNETYGIRTKYSFEDRNNLEENQIGRIVINSDIDRLDLLSTEVYGRSDLDWIFTSFNNVRDPLSWLKIGLVVEYPISLVVFSEL